ncbi:MAG: cupin domain-containing protein [Arenibacter algicola]|nr:cupin domain-containing protein [Arenibacter algicola]
MKYFLILLCLVMPAVLQTRLQAAEVSPLLSKELAGFSEQYESLMLTVELAPGESSLPHRHNAHVFVYLLSGALQMQVGGGELKSLRAGDTFYESPQDIHAVSHNPSSTDPAKFVVFMVKEIGAPVSVPAE